MGDISEKEYEALSLNEFLKYRSETKMTCITPNCSKANIEKIVDSEEGPHSFIYTDVRLPEGGTRVKNVPMKHVCPECMIQMETISTEYFKKEDSEKMSFFAPKAKGDRGKNYYKDFSKQSWKDDPEAGKNATELSKKDIEKLKNL